MRAVRAAIPTTTRSPSSAGTNNTVAFLVRGTKITGTMVAVAGGVAVGVAGGVAEGVAVL